MESIGAPIGSFHHVFLSGENVLEMFQVVLNDSLSEKLGCSRLRDIVFQDIDDELKLPECRGFLISAAPESARRTKFSLVCSLTRNGDIQAVRWWVLIRGPIDPNKVFWRCAFSPFTISVRFFPYLRRLWNPSNGLTSIDNSFFNEIDILNRTREINFLAFEALVEVLESFGIDTSDLKQQKGNVLNINVSGGKTSFGSLVQGSKNTISGTAN
ncbi:hypothetical protein [Pseudomonas sp. C2B4]|uniref:hypothetical protein n=1 Tax=Pseudomonas sp. C2B4 TaxID=2735270 RepID=UPI0015867FF4|nr:hypothetical protein [Pseudomonas sp. C2B4]NUU35160.1 hypothetical protein [Pseudomonas sp. C2B4]